MEIVDTSAVLFQNFPTQNVKKCKCNNGFFVIDAWVTQTTYINVSTTTVLCKKIDIIYLTQSASIHI